MLILIILISSIFFTYITFLRLKVLRRKKIANQPFPEDWLKILRTTVAIYQILPKHYKLELLKHIQIFIDEKRFYGCVGLKVTEEMKVTIAAYACVLLLNRKTDYYPNFSSIYIYPSTYIAKHESWDGIVKTIGKSVRLGESWKRGPIILAWDTVLHDAHDIRDGHNVVLHEFAHKLDEEDGQMDGTPLMLQRARYTSWGRIMGREYKRFQKKVKNLIPDILNSYGATKPAEFFAVLTETFFEKPKQLKNKHPDIYNELQKFYHVDPINWVNNHDS